MKTDKTEKLLNRIEKLSEAEKLWIAKMILMGVADSEPHFNTPKGEILWNAKDMVIDFEQAV